MSHRISVTCRAARQGRVLPGIAGTLALSIASILIATGAFAVCADDAVLVAGVLCVDKYEASVWSNPPGSGDLGTQYGVAGVDYPCARNGEDCDRIYAASLAGQRPSVLATWFQAQQACANVGKRLLTNAEWQLAGTATPDTGASDDGTTTCHTDNALTASTVATGSRSGCVSRWGAYDMVGNASEMVADWVPISSACTGWGDLSDDSMCLAGTEPTVDSPGVLVRGGSFFNKKASGPLAVFGNGGPRLGGQFVGFRCVRPAS